MKIWAAHFRNSWHGRFGHSLLGIAGRWIEATRGSLSQPELGQITVGDNLYSCMEWGNIEPTPEKVESLSSKVSAAYFLD
jgi:hypothetical protein